MPESTAGGVGDDALVNDKNVNDLSPARNTVAVFFPSPAAVRWRTHTLSPRLIEPPADTKLPEQLRDHSPPETDTSIGAELVALTITLFDTANAFGVAESAVRNGFENEIP